MLQVDFSNHYYFKALAISLSQLFSESYKAGTAWNNGDNYKDFIETWKGRPQCSVWQLATWTSALCNILSAKEVQSVSEKITFSSPQTFIFPTCQVIKSFSVLLKKRRHLLEGSILVSLPLLCAFTSTMEEVALLYSTAISIHCSILSVRHMGLSKEKSSCSLHTFCSSLIHKLIYSCW